MPRKLHWNHKPPRITPSSPSDSIISRPKQYKNHFKEWGLWKNISTRDATKLIQMKASRDLIGKTSTFVCAGRKLNLNRVKKNLHRSGNKIAIEEKPPADCGKPSRVECRTPSPEPLSGDVDLDLLEGLESNSIVDTTALDRAFGNSTSDISHTHVSDSLESFIPDNVEQFKPSETSEDPYFELTWECYLRVHHKLALRCEWLQTNALSDSLLRRFRRNNTLLAMLEPIVALNQHSIMRLLFLANFVSAFIHRPEFSTFTQHVQQTIQADTLHHATVIENALQYLGLQTYTRRFIGREEHSDTPGSPPSSGESISAANIESSNNNVSPGAVSFNHDDKGPDPADLEVAMFAYQLGETDTADMRLRALTCYEGSISTRGQVLTRLAWYCYSCIQRELGRCDEANRSLIQSIRGSTFYPATNGTEWDEIGYLFM